MEREKLVTWASKLPREDWYVIRISIPGANTDGYIMSSSLVLGRSRRALTEKKCLTETDVRVINSTISGNKITVGLISRVIAQDSHSSNRTLHTYKRDRNSAFARSRFARNLENRSGTSRPPHQEVSSKFSIVRHETITENSFSRWRPNILKNRMQKDAPRWYSTEIFVGTLK